MVLITSEASPQWDVQCRSSYCSYCTLFLFSAISLPERLLKRRRRTRLDESTTLQGLRSGSKRNVLKRGGTSLITVLSADFVLSTLILTLPSCLVCLRDAGGFQFLSTAFCQIPAKERFLRLADQELTGYPLQNVPLNTTFRQA